MSSENPNQADSPSSNTPPSKKSRWLSWLPYLLIPAVVYFGNVEFQSYLGRQALAETGLTMHELDEALKLAKEQDKYVLADMSAIWCPSCRKLDKEVLSNDAVKKAIESQYVFSRIEYETDEGKAFMQKYGVSGFPTLLILDTDGTKVSTLPLTFSPEQFISLISR